MNLMRTFSANPRRWMMIGFLTTIPTVSFWIAVAIAHFLRNPKYVNILLSFGGSFTHIILVAGLPICSFIIAMISHHALRREAISRNLWHRETNDMRVNQNLIVWSILLLAVTIIDLIKTS